MENNNGRKIYQIQRLTSLIVISLEMAEEENVSVSNKICFEGSALKYYDLMGEVLNKGYIGEEDITAYPDDEEMTPPEEPEMEKQED